MPPKRGGGTSSTPNNGVTVGNLSSVNKLNQSKSSIARLILEGVHLSKMQVSDLIKQRLCRIQKTNKPKEKRFAGTFEISLQNAFSSLFNVVLRIYVYVLYSTSSRCFSNTTTYIRVCMHL